MLGQKALRMELHAYNRQLLMPNRHNLLGSVRRVRPSANSKIARQRVRSNHEAMIARRSQRRWQSLKNALSIMLNLIRLAVHQPFGPYDHAARRLTDRLMPE